MIRNVQPSSFTSLKGLHFIRVIVCIVSFRQLFFRPRLLINIKFNALRFITCCLLTAPTGRSLSYFVRVFGLLRSFVPFKKPVGSCRLSLERFRPAFFTGLGALLPLAGFAVATSCEPCTFTHFLYKSSIYLLF